MEQCRYLRLCTFEVATPVGRCRRLGTHQGGRIVDLNFATAWYMAQMGEPEPQRMADALVPCDLLQYLRAGLRAVHTAEELFLGAGPHPPDWWCLDDPPAGPNGETLIYGRDRVRLLGLFGTEAEVRGASTCEWELAGIMDARRCVAGYTLWLRAGRYATLGPYLVNPAELGDPGEIEWVTRVNGSEAGRGKLGRGVQADTTLAPGEVIGGGVLGSVPLGAGDVLEVSAPLIGALEVRAV